MPDTISIPEQDALGLGAFGGGWSVGTVLDISSLGQKHFTVNRDTSVLHVYSDSKVYILFDASADASTAETANATANDLILDAGRHSIPVPRGLYSGEVDGAQNKKVIYLHVLQVTSEASKSFRVVES
jgi:hypothetical protein